MWANQICYDPFSNFIGFNQNESPYNEKLFHFMEIFMKQIYSIASAEQVSRNARMQT